MIARTETKAARKIPTRVHAMVKSENSVKRDVVQLEISIATLERLFKKGELCAAEIRCLNDESKGSIRKICLASCVYNIECSYAEYGCQASCDQSTGRRLLSSDVNIPDQDPSISFCRTPPQLDKR